MPAAAVYFVIFLCSPSIAKSLINSGVGKSGSPTVKSITSKPSSRKLAAACIALNVEDVFIRATLSETGKEVIIIYLKSKPAKGELKKQNNSGSSNLLLILHDFLICHEIRNVKIFNPGDKNDLCL